MNKQLNNNMYNYPGTYQNKRFPTELNPQCVKIDDRSFESLIESLIEFSSRVKFYDKSDEKSNGNWLDFFNYIIDNEDNNKSDSKVKNSLINNKKDVGEEGKIKLDPKLLHNLEESGTMQPHLALMLAFLKIFAIEQDGINEQVQKHLDFYYKKILGFSPKKGTVGNVFARINLNKNCNQVILPAGTKFYAGKDNNGRTITYISSTDTTIYESQVTQLKTFDSSKIYNPTKSNSPKCGIALTSPLLSIEKIESFEFNYDITKLKNIKIFYTTKDGLAEAKINILRNSRNLGMSKPNFYILKKVNIKIGNDSLSSYNEKVHKLGLNYNEPVIFISFPSINDINNQLSGIPQISSVNVLLPSSLVKIRNKQGIFNNDKSVYPFGTNPSINDSFDLLLPKIEGCQESILNFEIKDCINFGKFTYKNDNYSTQLTNDGGYAEYLKNLFRETAKAAKGETAQIPTYPIAPNIIKPFSVKAKYVLSTDNPIATLVSPNGNSIIKTKNDLSLYSCSYKQTIIGISIVEACKSLSLFLQFSHKNFYSKSKINPVWEIFTGEKWEDAKVLKDGTNCLTKDGLLLFDLSSFSTELSHYLFNEKLLWLRLTTKEGEMPDIKSITSQVVELEYDKNSEGKAICGYSVPPGTITKLVHPIQGIKNIDQLFAGEYGYYDESTHGFYTRVSERLRHKDRAVNIWDYERIILQNFPSIEAAVCIPYSCDDSFSNGTVTIILVPKIIDEGDLMPTVSPKIIHEVSDFLYERVSPFVNLIVQGPKYESVNLSVDIFLKKEYTDVNVYQNKIKNALISLLTPWYNGEGQISLLNSFNESQILLFLEQLEYIDNVRNLKIFVGDNKKEVKTGADITSSCYGNILTAGDEINVTVKISN